MDTPVTKKGPLNTLHENFIGIINSSTDKKCTFIFFPIWFAGGHQCLTYLYGIYHCTVWHGRAEEKRPIGKAPKEPKPTSFFLDSP